MLASDHWADNIARAYDMGLGGYLTKPIRRSDLLQTISIAFDRSKGTQHTAGFASVAPTSSTELRALRILLAEDSSDNQMLVRSYLKQNPYHLDIAGHGASALEQFKSGNYDLILMDMQMPTMDGVTATREIRRLAPQSAVPIVAMTANVMQEDRQRCFEAGMNDFVSKPIDPDELVAVLLKWITPGQARHRHESSRPTVSAKDLD